MFQSKYQFNEETLSYDRLELSFKEKAFKFLSVVIGFSILVAVVAYSVFSYMLNETDYEQVKAEREHYASQFEILDQKVQQLSEVLADMQERDDNIYRLTFSMEPVPQSVRNAGFGGADRYAHLDKGYEYSDLISQTAQRIDQLTKQLVVQSRSYDEIIEQAQSKAEELACLPALMPISKHESHLGSHFGMRLHPILHIYRMHEGVDFSASPGTKIYASGNGRVIEAEYSGGYGNQVTIDHGYGFKTVYAHMSGYAVRAGEQVKRGQLIGYVGTSGLSTNPHLHYEVFKDGVAVNPINYYFSDITPQEYNAMIQAATYGNGQATK